MEQRRKKLKGKKRTMGWMAWRKEIVVSLWLCILSVLEFCNFFFLEYYICLWVKIECE